MPDATLLARIQFAANITFHILFPAISIALAWVLLFFKLCVNVKLPIVFIAGHGDIPMTVQSMKGGAIEFLTKPFRDQDLLDAVNVGLERGRARRANKP